MSENTAPPPAAANPMAARHEPAPAADLDVAAVEEALRDVIDPELGINVVDLGLLYGVTIEPDGTIVLDMTLTTAACPLTDLIEGTTSGPPRELSVAPSCDRGRPVAVAVYIHVMHVMHGVERMHGLVEKRMTATLRQIENGLTASDMMHSGAGHQQSITRRRAW